MPGNKSTSAAAACHASGATLGGIKPEDGDADGVSVGSSRDDHRGGRGQKGKKRPREHARERDGGGGGGGGGDTEEDSLSASNKTANSEEGKEDDPAAATSDGAEGGGGVGGGGRTCVACRKSKVKCSRGSPCQRCSRLKLECVAQVRGRGRPVANSSASATRRNGKTEEKGGSAARSSGGFGGGGVGVGGGGDARARAGDGSYSSASSSSSGGFPARGGGGGASSSAGIGMFSSALASSGAAAAGGGGGREGVVVTGGASRSTQQGDPRAGCSSHVFSSAGDVPPAVAAGRDGSCMTPASVSLGFAAGPLSAGGRGSSAGADNGDDLVGGGVGFGHQQFDASSRMFQSGNLLPSERSQQQHQQQPPRGYGGSSDAGDGGATSLAANGSRHRSVSSGGAWRAVFHGGKNVGPGNSRSNSFGDVGGGAADADSYAIAGGQCEFMNTPLTSTTRVNGGVDTAVDSFLSTSMGYRATSTTTTAVGAEGLGSGDGRGGGNGGRSSSSSGGGGGGKGRGSSLSSDGGFSSFCGKDVSWAETADEHKDAIAAAAAAANGDERARWLVDFQRVSGAESEDRLPEANGGKRGGQW